MPIRGLEQGQPARAAAIDCLGDEVGASMEALGRLGLVPEHVEDQVAADLATDYETVRTGSGKTGELYVCLQPSLVTVEHINNVSDGGTYHSGKRYPESRLDDFGKGIYGPWTTHCEPDHPLDSVNQTWRTHGRLAVAASSGSLLHFLGMPYDSLYAELKEKQSDDPYHELFGEREDTQLQALETERQAYETDNPNFNMIALDALAIAFITLKSRILGCLPPITEGSINLPTRTSRSRVWGERIRSMHVVSYDGRLVYTSLPGRSKQGCGLGISVGSTV